MTRNLKIRSDVCLLYFGATELLSLFIALVAEFGVLLAPTPAAKAGGTLVEFRDIR